MNVINRLLSLGLLCLLLLCGKISIRDFSYHTSIKRGRCKTIREVCKDISDNKVQKHKPVLPSDLKEIYSYKTMNLSEKEITELVCQAINIRVKRGDYKPLIEKVSLALVKNADDLSVLWLSDVEILAITGGLFILAYKFRQLCVSKLIDKYEQKKKVRYHDVRKLYAGYLYSGKPEKAADVISKAEKLWKLRYNGTWQLMSVFAGRGTLSEYVAGLRMDTQADKNFYKLVNSKSIAILGPAVGELNTDEIIKEFDLVIRLNYRGVELSGVDARRCGVDISYYATPNSAEFAEKKDYRVLEELKMMVFHGKLRHEFQKELFINGKGRSKKGKTEHFMFYGHGNIGQYALLDLFHFSPARIKLFNFNLFLANIGERYREGYAPVGKPQNIEFKWRGYGCHNSISNYELMKQWHDAGYFEADEVLTEVLSLGTAEYASRMELLE